MRQLFIVLIFIVAMVGCMEVQEWPYCKNHIVAVVLSSFLEIDENEDSYFFTKIHGNEKFKYLDWMFADTDGITEADPAYFELAAKLRQKLMQGHADMFYACDDDSELFLCIDYDADETISNEYKPGTLSWRWCLLYPYLYVKYDLHTHKYVEIGSGHVDGAKIEEYMRKVS